MHIRTLRTAAAITAVGAVVVLPAQAGAVTAHAATTKRASFSLHAHITSTKTTGTQHGHGTITGAFKGTYTAAVSPPLTKYVLSVPGGKIDISALYNIKGKALSGAWHTTGGTGRYRHVKGSGHAKGTLATNATFSFTGTLRY